MLSIDPKNTPTGDLHQYLLGAVSPRPIAFVSTISESGEANLAPYSFFNAFSSNPPTVIFSSNRRVADNTTKDTLANAEAVREVVINMVSHDIVRQMALTSVNYPTGTSEFEKAGLTPIPSEKVKPFRVAESPVQMECIVKDIISLGSEGGAGNLVICEVIQMHIDEAVLDETGKIDPWKIDLMGRMGRAFYCRASGDSVMKIFQAVDKIGIGIDSLPLSVQQSRHLSGWDLATLGALTAIPSEDEVDAVRVDPAVMNALAGNQQEQASHLHTYAKQLIEAGEVEKALKVVML